jgi:hypothetical protein
MAERVLEVDGRESSYVDENDCFRTARIARLDNIAIAEASGKVEGYLIELNDPTAFRLKAKRRLFSFEADDFGAPRLKESAGPPDLWYNTAVSGLTQRLDSRG